MFVVDNKYFHTLLAEEEREVGMVGCKWNQMSSDTNVKT